MCVASSASEYAGSLHRRSQGATLTRTPRIERRTSSEAAGACAPRMSRTTVRQPGARISYVALRSLALIHPHLLHQAQRSRAPWLLRPATWPNATVEHLRRPCGRATLASTTRARLSLHETKHSLLAPVQVGANVGHVAILSGGTSTSVPRLRPRQTPTSAERLPGSSCLLSVTDGRRTPCPRQYTRLHHSRWKSKFHQTVTQTLDTKCTHPLLHFHSFMIFVL